jgi:uncharacterized protein (TIGR02284 family)
MGMQSDKTIEQLNELLRGEISAAETYKMAMDKIEKNDRFQPRIDMLHEMQRDHGAAAQRLREQIRALGGEADNDSGAWGAWAKLTQGTSNLFGDKAALKSLKEGEEHGMKDYERTLKDGLDPGAEQLVSQLLSQQRQHVETLDRLMQMS